MRIDLYAPCFNEADMLGFFFRHYDPIVQRYVVFDDGSTDNPVEILRSHPNVEIRPMPVYDPDSWLASQLALQESCWKESRGVADWVIVTDIDEHLHHPDLAGYLDTCLRRGVTVIPALGYHMVSEEFPPAEAVLSRKLTLGAPAPAMNKMSIFSPDAVEATNFTVGRHDAAPQGTIVPPERDELLLLHYKFLGFERLMRRHQTINQRQGQKDLEMKWGYHYAWSAEELRKYWDDTTRGALDVANPELRPWDTHAGPRWWRRHPA